MSWVLVSQPDGKYAVFSHSENKFVAKDLTPDQALDKYVEEALEHARHAFPYTKNRADAHPERWQQCLDAEKQAQESMIARDA